VDEYLDILARLTVAEFRAFKRAVALLVRAGMSHRDAIETILTARHNRRAGNGTFGR
jgi:hypothetical protein